MKNKNLLYVYEERIPEILQKLVILEIKKKFNLKKMTYKTSLKHQKKLFSWCDAVLFAPGRYLENEVVESAKNCKIFQLWSSGFDKFNVKAAKKNNITICNNGSQNNISVAEHAVMLMLSLNRKLIHFNNITKNGNWAGNSHGVDLFEMKNKVLGIIGFGNIGKTVAKICSGFDMKVIYFDTIKLSKKRKDFTTFPTHQKQICLKSQILSLYIFI